LLEARQSQKASVFHPFYFFWDDYINKAVETSISGKYIKPHWTFAFYFDKRNSVKIGDFSGFKDSFGSWRGEKASVL
jgi:hypothetical protein